MAELDKTALYAKIDEKFPISPTDKVRSKDANELCKDIVDSVLNIIDDSALLGAGIIKEFEAAEGQTEFDAGLVVPDFFLVAINGFLIFKGFVKTAPQVMTMGYGQKEGTEIVIFK